MWRRIVVFFGLVAAAYALRLLPNIPIPGWDGKPIDLRQYRGKVVTLVMISTQCGDCIITVGVLDKLQREYGPRGLQTVGAAINDDAPKEIASFVQRYRPGYPFGYLDRDSAVKLAAIPPGKRPFVPILMFIDRKGMVYFQFYGDDPGLKDGEKLVRSLETGLLNQDSNKPPQIVNKPGAVPH